MSLKVTRLLPAQRSSLNYAGLNRTHLCLMARGVCHDPGLLTSPDRLPFLFYLQRDCLSSELSNSPDGVRLHLSLWNPSVPFRFSPQSPLVN